MTFEEAKAKRGAGCVLFRREAWRRKGFATSIKFTAFGITKEAVAVFDRNSITIRDRAADDWEVGSGAATFAAWSRKC